MDTEKNLQMEEESNDGKQSERQDEQETGNSSELFEQFTRAQWLLHRYHHYNQRVYGPLGDPHRGQGRILKLLKLQPAISQKDLSYLLGMRPQSLGELLAKLEHSGYIVRTPAETDRRVMNIKLTELGAQAAERQGNMETPFDCLSEEEKSFFSQCLDKIIGSVEQMLSDEQFDERFGPNFPWRGDERGRPAFGAGPGHMPFVQHHGPKHDRESGRPPFGGDFNRA